MAGRGDVDCLGHAIRRVWHLEYTAVVADHSAPMRPYFAHRLPCGKYLELFLVADRINDDFLMGCC
jgi:hypothetical protein